MSIFTFILAHLSHRWLRTTLTVLSVAIASGILTVMISSQHLLGKLVRQGNFALAVTPVSWSRNTLPFSYVEPLKRIPGVVEVHYFQGLEVDDPDTSFKYFFLGGSENLHDRVPKGSFVISDEEIKRWKADRQGVLASNSLIEHFHWQVGEVRSFPTKRGPIQLRLSGKIEGYMASGNFGHVRYEYSNLFSTNPDQVILFTSPDSQADMAPLARAIDEHFASEPEPTFTFPGAQWEELRSQRSAAIPTLLFQISLLVFLVAALVTASTFAISLRERTSEFAVLRALGFNKLRVYCMILAESTFTATLGGLVGSGAMWVLYHRQGLNLGSWSVLQDVRIENNATLVTILGTAVLGLTMSALPAWSVVKRDIIQALEGA